MNDKIHELMQTKEGRQILSKHSPSFFASYYLGYSYTNHQDRWLKLIDNLVTEGKKTNEKKKLLLLAPRDHGKSMLCVAVTLRALCLDRNTRILWLSKSMGQAEKRVRVCKNYLQSQKLIDDWASDEPFQRKNEDKWTSTQIYLNRTLNSIDPSVEAIGSGGSITGGHFDMIIIDDLEDEKTVFSATQRQKTRDWLRGTCMPMLTKGGTMVVVGTRKHYDDAYNMMIKDPTFQVVNTPAIIKWPKSYKHVIKEVDGRDLWQDVVIEGDYEVLWPEERGIKLLLKELYSAGSLSFTREFQNQVQSDADAIFKMQWLDQAKERGFFYSYGEIPPVERMVVVQAWDLALKTDKKSAEEQDSDYTVGITLGKDEKGNHYLLSMFRDRGLTPSQIYQAIIDEYNKFKKLCHVISIEKNNFGQLHTFTLQKNTDLPIREHVTTAGNKNSAWIGVPSLTTLFENGKMTMPSKTPEDLDRSDILCTELYGLGKEKHDDTVMCLWIAVSAMRDSDFQYSISIGDDYHIDAHGEKMASSNHNFNYHKHAESSSMQSLWESLSVDYDIDDDGEY